MLLTVLLLVHAVLVTTDALDKSIELLYDYENVSSPNRTIGLLYPRESETRDVRTLDGIWRFLKSNISDPEQGVREHWYAIGLDNVSATIQMPVPASYNDITVDATLRDHVGIVWYERTFYAPVSWSKWSRTWLRFGSVHYNATVYINGMLVTRHSIGHLPFEADVSKYIRFGNENRVTVMCDNRLNNRTIPQGIVDNENLQTYTFDFFNYAGIHRSVHLYTTPLVYISEISVDTQLSPEGLGRIDYVLTIGGGSTFSHVNLKLRDKNGMVVAHQTNRSPSKGTLLVPNVQPWWPYLMHPLPGYLYSLEIALYDEDVFLDVYRLPVGIRSLSWNEQSVLINGQPVYLRGFGKHEDSDIRGKGLDLALLTRDFSLLQWVGANAYRTSHYPYSEESMQFADEHGIMIIDECSSVNTDIFEPQLLSNHMSALEQLIHRDHNHPSVIMWSIANEPRTAKSSSEAYFSKLANFTRGIAHGRPLTAATNVIIEVDRMPQFLDIVGFNRYNGWYHYAGQLDVIASNVYSEAVNRFDLYKKPIIMFEYGADTMEGYHSLPSFIWSEDYQVALFSKHFEAFDQLRKHKWFIGEFVWNFADFKTAQTYLRVGGNKKGIFTRNRQPKDVAKLLRQRYHALAYQLNNSTLPSDLFNYIISW